MMFVALARLGSPPSAAFNALIRRGMVTSLRFSAADAARTLAALASLMHDCDFQAGAESTRLRLLQAQLEHRASLLADFLPAELLWAPLAPHAVRGRTPPPALVEGPQARAMELKRRLRPRDMASLLWALAAVQQRPREALLRAIFQRLGQTDARCCPHPPTRMRPPALLAARACGQPRVKRAALKRWILILMARPAGGLPTIARRWRGRSPW